MREREIIDPIWPFLIAAIVGAIIVAGFVPSGGHHSVNPRSLEWSIKPVLEIYKNGKLVYRSPDPISPALLREIMCHFLVSSSARETVCKVHFEGVLGGTYYNNYYYLPMTPGPLQFVLGFNDTPCYLTGSNIVDGYLFYTSLTAYAPTKVLMYASPSNETLVIEYLFNATFNGNLSSVELLGGWGQTIVSPGPFAQAIFFCDNVTPPIPFVIGDSILIKYTIVFNNTPPFLADFWNATILWVFSSYIYGVRPETNVPKVGDIGIVPGVNIAWPWSYDMASALNSSLPNVFIGAAGWSYTLFNDTLIVKFYGVPNTVYSNVGSIVVVVKNATGFWPIAYFPLNGSYTLGNQNYVGVSLGIVVSEG